MKKIVLTFFLLLAVVSVAFIVDTETENPRKPASIPSNYEALGACEKQEVLWEKAKTSIYTELPDYKKLGLQQLVAMSMQQLQIKGNLHSDFSPEGWKKYLHRRGALAKVKIVSVDNINRNLIVL